MNTVAAFLFVIAILIFVHEFGHFFVAKLAGIRVEKFSLGFGRRLLGFRRGETEYAVSLLPLGGYVKMAGEGGEWGLIVEEVAEGSLAEKAGLRPGDKVTAVDGTELAGVESWAELRKLLEKTGRNKHLFVVERDGRRVEIEFSLDDLGGALIYAVREYPRSFSRKPIPARLAVVLAGPFMNLLFPFVVMPLVFLIGIHVPKYLDEAPVVGWVAEGSPAAEAGFEPGQEIVDINGTPVRSWRDVNVMVGANPGARLEVTVRKEGRTRTLVVESPRDPTVTEGLGIAPPLEARVGSVLRGTPAEKAGLRPGDRIVAVNGVAVASWYEMASVIRRNAGREIVLTVEREGAVLKVPVTPRPIDAAGRGAIGITPQREEVLKKYGFARSVVEGIESAAKMVRDITVLLIGFLLKLITGKISLSVAGKTIAGPIAIADFSGAAARGGLASLLQFMAFISVNLAVINLFPIPVLDGGHVVYLAIEAVRRRPLSMRTLELVQRMGFAFLIFIMLLAVYNDLARLDLVDKLAELMRK